MPALDNRTGFAAVDFVSLAKGGEQRLVVCVAGTFQFAPGDGARAPVLAEKQEPPMLKDGYTGEPGLSSLRFEGQSAYTRPGTDVYVTGHAWAPRGKPTTAMLVEVRVGPIDKQVAVLGDRVWQRSLYGVEPSAAGPFVSMPLTYELAFGGNASMQEGKPIEYEARNPVGRGFYRSAGEATGKPLPNIEDRDELIRSVKARPQPQGLGPIARSWMPRVKLAGTYDERWVNERAPEWPDDFDERFFCAASPGMNAQPHLRGGEAVELVGLSPSGSIHLHLPTHRLLARASFQGEERRCQMVLDAVHLEPDEGRLSLTWRASIPVQGMLAKHEVTLIRELGPAEEAR